MYGHIFQHKNSAEYSQIKILKTRYYQKVYGCSGFCMVFFFVYLWTAIMSSHTQLIVSLNFASKELIPNSNPYGKKISRVAIPFTCASFMHLYLAEDNCKIVMG